MKCPYCGYKESRVVDSRPADEGNSIRRRRECLACEKRFTTYETMESLPMVVIKKDGSRQSFDRNKVLGSMLRACEKRTVPLARLEQMAEEIEQNLQNNLEREITTDMVGERGGLCPLRLRLPAVQGYPHLYGRADQAAGGKITDPPPLPGEAGAYGKQAAVGPCLFCYY